MLELESNSSKELVNVDARMVIHDERTLINEFMDVHFCSLSPKR